MSVGIDFGTSKVCVAVHHDNQVLVLRNEYDERTTPCYVGFGDNEIHIGETAAKNNMQYMENTVYQMKRLIGRTPGDKEIENDVKRWEFDMNDQSEIGVKFCSRLRCYRVEEITSLLICKMIKLAEKKLSHEVSEAFISVPACFNDRQRRSIEEAGLIAGLESVQLVNETTAASFAYNYNRQDKKTQTVLIFDLGAGSFDLSVCKLDARNVEVLATRGNSHFGGDDLCVRMIEYCVKRFEETHKVDLSKNKKAKRRLWSECDEAKKKLSNNKKASIYVDNLVGDKYFQIDITREEFENMNKDFFEKIEELTGEIIRDAEEKPGRFRNSTTRIIKKVVLVGGSTRIPKVRDILTDVFNLDLKKTVNPDEAVAAGAALTGFYKLKELQSTNNEIALYPMNIEVANNVLATKSIQEKINIKRKRMDELKSEDKKCRKVRIAKNNLEEEIRAEIRKYKIMKCSKEMRKLLLGDCDTMLKELEETEKLERVHELRYKLQQLRSSATRQSISYPTQTRDEPNNGSVEKDQQLQNIYGNEENIDELSTLHSRETEVGQLSSKQNVDVPDPRKIKRPPKEDTVNQQQQVLPDADTHAKGTVTRPLQNTETAQQGHQHQTGRDVHNVGPRKRPSQITNEQNRKKRQKPNSKTQSHDVENCFLLKTYGINTQNEHRKTEQDYEKHNKLQSVKSDFSKELLHRQQISKRETSNAAAHSNDNKKQNVYVSARIENDDTKRREALQIYLEFKYPEELQKKQEKYKQNIRTVNGNDSLLQIKNASSGKTEDNQSKNEESEKVQKSSNESLPKKQPGKKNEIEQNLGSGKTSDLVEKHTQTKKAKKIVKRFFRLKKSSNGSKEKTTKKEFKRGQRKHSPGHTNVVEVESSEEPISQDKTSKPKNKTGCFGCSKRSSTSSIQRASNNFEQEKKKHLVKLYEYEEYINKRINSNKFSYGADKIKKTFRNAERDINKAKDIHEIGKILERVQTTCEEQAKHWNIPLTRNLRLQVVTYL